MLIFQKNSMEEIFSHAQKEYPGECCGILLGRSSSCQRIVCKILQTVNTAKDSVHFQISPSDLVKAEWMAEEEGLEIIGFYHSHPDYEASVSKTDIQHMIAGYSYPIVSVRNGRCVGTKSFRKQNQTDTTVTAEDIWG